MSIAFEALATSVNFALGLIGGLCLWRFADSGDVFYLLAAGTMWLFSLAVIRGHVHEVICDLEDSEESAK